MYRNPVFVLGDEGAVAKWQWEGSLLKIWNKPVLFNHFTWRCTLHRQKVPKTPHPTKERDLQFFLKWVFNGYYLWQLSQLLANILSSESRTKVLLLTFTLPKSLSSCNEHSNLILTRINTFTEWQPCWRYGCFRGLFIANATSLSSSSSVNKLQCI